MPLERGLGTPKLIFSPEGTFGSGKERIFICSKIGVNGGFRHNSTVSALVSQALGDEVQGRPG